MVPTAQNSKGEPDEETQGDPRPRRGTMRKCHPKKQVEELLHEHEQGGTPQIEFNSIRNNLTDAITQPPKQEPVTAGTTVFGERHMEVAAASSPKTHNKVAAPTHAKDSSSQDPDTTVWGQNRGGLHPPSGTKVRQPPVEHEEDSDSDTLSWGQCTLRRRNHPHRARAPLAQEQWCA